MKQIGLAFFFYLLFTTSCTSRFQVNGEGPVVTETRKIDNFSGVDLRISGKVFYNMGADYKVEIKAQQNILDVLETNKSNNKLVIKLGNDVGLGRHDEIIVNVTAPDLNSLRISGSGQIKSSGKFSSGHTDLSISGTGRIIVSSIETDYLTASISGSGNIDVLDGTATEEKLQISGSGDIGVKDVAAENVSATTSGSGNIRVWAAQKLAVTISGNGSVFYVGQPAINTHISGSGKIIKL